MAPKSSKAATKTSTKPDINPNSSLTPESFEKELKDLAAKAKDETWGKWIFEQSTAYLGSATLLSLLAIYSNASQLALSPVYGSIPASRWHSNVVIAGCFVGWSSNLFLMRMLPFRTPWLLPVIAIWIPTVQYFLEKLSGVMTAYWGPLITETLTLFPLVAFSVACVATYLENIDLSSLPKWVSDAAPGLGSYSVFKAAEKISGIYIQKYIGKTFINTRLGLEMVLAASYTLFAPSKLLLYTIPALLHTALFNTHVPTPMALSALNTTLSSDGWMILDRKESLTGYISVVESKSQGFRVMRCDHSLLGGEWVKFIGTGQFKGNKVAEPIYAVFAMLEAVRLVEVPKPVPDSEASALVIGLGIGTLPAALVAHGVDTTVVEIDPVVHEFALKYFQLPSNHTPVIEDAVSYAANLANDTTGKRFDYIVHDVFTGGAEPIDLFTLEFLQNLSDLLKPGGVIAINYAGDFGLPSPKVVVRTIRTVFPTCRIFREHPREDDGTEGDFTNMVIFCTKRAGSKLTFRRPTARDLLNSPSRQQLLPPKHEVPDSHFVLAEGEKDLGILRKNDTQKLDKWHTQSALGHWTVMRVVLPAHVWESW